MEVDVLKLKKMLKNNKVVLLDVREPHETDICHVKGSLFIPMNEIPQKINQLDKEKSYDFRTLLTCDLTFLGWSPKELPDKYMNGFSY